MCCRTLRILALVAVLLSSLALAEDGGKTRSGLTEEQRRLNLEAFDQVWETIRDRHWEPGMRGLDWEAFRVELRPEVENARTMEEARSYIADMIAALGYSHFAIIPGDVYEKLDGTGEARSLDGTVGLDVRVIDGHALVTSVRPGSPASREGIGTGWEILRVGEQDVAELIAAVEKQFADTPWKDAVLSGAVLRRLQGPVGEAVPVTLLDGSDRIAPVELARVEEKGRKYELGHLPPMHIWIETRRLEENVGYIRFNAFMDPVELMPAFDAAMRSFQDADGVVIDLRGNPGGIGAMAMGMAGWFVREKGHHLGTFTTREVELEVTINPRLDAYAGPLAVLVDNSSGSASELFSGGLQDIGRARVFGARTAGAALPSTIEKLPNGDCFQYVIGNFVSAGGRSLEGVGVTPDVEVRPTREDLLKGRDPVLDAALLWIRSPE